jgi:hypothetical protein
VFNVFNNVNFGTPAPDIFSRASAHHRQPAVDAIRAEA